MTEAALVEELGERFSEAIYSGDVAALDRLLAPNFQIWYNTVDSSLDRGPALTFWGEHFKRVKTRCRDVVRHPTPTGWVEEHRIDANGDDGYEFQGMPACVVFTVENGLISRINEYFDSAQTGGFDNSQLPTEGGER